MILGKLQWSFLVLFTDKMFPHTNSIKKFDIPQTSGCCHTNISEVLSTQLLDNHVNSLLNVSIFQGRPLCG